LAVEDMERSLQRNPEFIGNDAPSDHKSHIEDSKRQTAKATNQATPPKKKDGDDIRPFVENHFTMRHRYALGFLMEVPRLISDGIRAFLWKTDK
jgi:hypothetical protein